MLPLRPACASARPPARAAVALLAVTLCGASLAACSSSGGHGASGSSSSPTAPSPTSTLSAFLSEWGHRDWAAMAKLVSDPPADFAAVNAQAFSTLGVTSAAYAAGKLQVTGTKAQAPVTETLQLPAFGTWTIPTTVNLTLTAGRWAVQWSPATIDPALGTDGRLAVSYEWPPRAAILASNGTAISPSQPSSVVIGLEGQYFKNTTSLSRSLVAAGAPASAVRSAITAATASPTAFEPVFTVSWGRYEQLRPTLYPIPGVFFQAEGGAGTSTPAPLVGVVGSLGAITKAELKRLGAPYTSTSVVGQGGLEEAYERQLAGTPGGTISVVSPGGATGATGSTRRTLFTKEPVPGTPVRTTIYLAVEQDAANALESAPNVSALVAIDAATGRIIAAANSSQGSDLALEGEQPPGSTMKMITSTALIEKGLTPSSPATCPSEIDVDGEELHNAEADEGSVPDLFAAFTVSCNTAFIGLTMANLGYTSLHDAALLYHVGVNWDPGLPVFTGSVPVNDGQTDLAASAIGQARVAMNPLDLAMVAADIDTGTVRLPWIAAGAPTEHAPTSKLPADLDSDLHEMMLSVVEQGTAAGTGLPAGTYAKTGTAEYGPQAQYIDAWLAGWNGDIAFAMLDVDAPGDGGPVDGPIVAKFLRSLGPSA